MGSNVILTELTGEWLEKSRSCYINKNLTQFFLSIDIAELASFFYSG